MQTERRVLINGDVMTAKTRPAFIALTVLFGVFGASRAGPVAAESVYDASVKVIKTSCDAYRDSPYNQLPDRHLKENGNFDAFTDSVTFERERVQVANSYIVLSGPNAGLINPSIFSFDLPAVNITLRRGYYLPSSTEIKVECVTGRCINYWFDYDENYKFSAEWEKRANTLDPDDGPYMITDFYFECADTEDVISAFQKLQDVLGPPTPSATE